MKKVYAISNPMWLADTFIFSQKDIPEKGMFPFVKVNSSNKIEGIGTDICKRMHGASIETIVEKASIATKLQASIFRRIDDEYWWSISKKI